jgi:uncharacterized protein (TIGR00251 family)
MIQVVSHAQGSVLAVRVQPRARRTLIVGEHQGALKVAVTAAPEKGKANEAVTRVLAEGLALSRSRVRLIAGETARDKRFLLVGIAARELTGRLRQLLTGERA